MTRLRAVAAFASAATFLTAGAGRAAAAGDLALGQYLAGDCVTCHRMSGAPATGIPTIVGWPQDQFIAALQAYKSGAREHTIMKTMVDPLSDADMAALATYFESLPHQPNSK